VDSQRLIAEAYRWQRRLGHDAIELDCCGIVADAAHPDLWDASHADNVTAESDGEIDAVLAAMDAHLGHSDWRVVHSDCFTSERFLARLACIGFIERPVVVQMLCAQLAPVRNAGAEIAEIADAAGWRALTALVRRDVEEGKRTGHLDLDRDFAGAMVASYRAKRPHYRFHLALLDGRAVGYGAMVAAPNGMGMIEDLFTLPEARGRGIASSLIAHFDRTLRAAGCAGVFLGAMADEEAKSLYFKLGFRPVMLARCWVRNVARVG